MPSQNWERHSRVLIVPCLINEMSAMRRFGFKKRKAGVHAGGRHIDLCENGAMT